MSKGIYVGVDNVARKVKKAFVGVDDKARKVKKAYIGVGGIARPFFSSEPELTYYGTLGGLELTSGGVSTALPNYALFLMGTPNNTLEVITVINAYDANLSNQLVGQGTSLDAAASVGEYALFSPYGDSEGIEGIETETKDTFVVNNDLVTSSAAKPTYSLQMRSGGSNGEYAIFYGGYWGNGYSSSIEAFDKNLTKTSLRMLGYTEDDDGYDSAASARNGRYAIFGGGEPAYDCRVVAIDENLQQTIMSPLEDGEHSRWEVSAVTVGTYTLFIGGVIEKLEDESNPYPLVDFVDVYDENLTKLTVMTLDEGRSSAGTTMLRDIALVAGGFVEGSVDPDYGTTNINSTDVLTFSNDLVQGVADSLVASSGGATAVETIGSYAIIIGDDPDPASSVQAQTDVYTAL